MLVGSSRETSWPRVSSAQLVVVVSVIAVCLAAFAVPATGTETEGSCAEAERIEASSKVAPASDIMELCEEERAERQQEAQRQAQEQEAEETRRQKREAREKREAEHRDILYVYTTRPNLTEVVLHVDAAPGVPVEVSVRADGHRIRQWTVNMPGKSGHGNKARQRTFPIRSLCQSQHPHLKYQFLVLDYGESGEKTRNGVFRGPHRAACSRRARANQRRREAAARRRRERRERETPEQREEAIDRELAAKATEHELNRAGTLLPIIEGCTRVSSGIYSCTFRASRCSREVVGRSTVTIRNERVVDVKMRFLKNPEC